VLGLVFLRLGKSQKNVQDRQGNDLTLATHRITCVARVLRMSGSTFLVSSFFASLCLGCLFFVCVQAMFMSFMSNLNTFGPEKLVMEREMQSGLYNLPAFFFSRWGVEVPFRVIFPLCYSAILYFMIGFQEEGENFILFAIGLILIDNCGTNSQTNTPPLIHCDGQPS
jgi:ABC-type multidrug transport system permease subunit